MSHDEGAAMASCEPREPASSPYQAGSTRTHIRVGVAMTYAASFLLPVYDWEGHFFLGIHVFWNLFAAYNHSRAFGLELLPNPLFWLGICCCGRRWFGIVGLVCGAAASYIAWFELPVRGLMVGAYIWGFSMVELMAASLYFLVEDLLMVWRHYR